MRPAKRPPRDSNHRRRRRPDASLRHPGVTCAAAGGAGVLRMPQRFARRRGRWQWGPWRREGDARCRGPDPRDHMPFRRHTSRNVSRFVARTIWRGHGISPLRGQAHRLHRRASLQGLLAPLETTFDLRHTASHGASMVGKHGHVCGLTGFVADRRLIIWRQTPETLSDYMLR
jgi:hypothetical protein